MTLPAPRRGRTFFIVTATAAGALFAGTLLAQTPPPSSSAPTPATGTTAAKQAPADAGAAKTPAGSPGAAGAKSATSYSLGVIMGTQLHNGGVRATDISAERVLQGLSDALSGKVKMGDSDRENLNTLLHGAFDTLVDSNHRAAAKFLAANGKKPDVVTTASGLQYKVQNAGSGAAPKPSEEVVVNYRGALLDGTEFDSSYKRGQPATLAVGRVIPGWTEALQLMKPGAKYQLWIPPQLAYDTHVPPGAPIPPGSMLVFDVELVSIKPPAPAASTPPAPMMPMPAPAGSPPPPK
jgi:FKBP-type peptidyl-prolyl cis-trans isomerase FkpA